MLLDRGASVSPRTISGITPFLVACQSGHLEMMKLLLKHGAQACALQLALACFANHGKQLRVFCARFLHECADLFCR